MKRSNRQDAREALDLAARGKVKCFFELKPLSALKEYAFLFLFIYLTG